MKVKRLRIQNFRIHDDFLIEFSEKSTLISGVNGSGKTSIIEALYFALQGTSFRSSDKEILKSNSNENWFRIDLIDQDDFLRTVKFDNSLANGKKQFIIDGNKKNRLPPSNKIPIILFEPDDLQLLNGSPVRRRAFLDRFLSQLFPTYSSLLSKYNKALKQRNMLLKSEKTSSDELFPWNLMLAEFGSEITIKRSELISKINQKINNSYFEISGVKDCIEIIYENDVIDKNTFFNILLNNTERDKILGHTSFGPHKHDIIFKFNGSDAKNVASRGENRSLVLALKFIETDILSENSDQDPIVLLDDVFSELDKTRQELLTRHFSKYQTIITSTDYVEVDDSKVVEIN